MPIKRERRYAYPANWREIAFAVKARCNWICETCGMQCRKPGEPFDTHKRTMSVSHQNHIESDCRPENLRGLCAACHLAYDRDLHTHHAAETRLRKKLEAGQGVLPC